MLSARDYHSSHHKNDGISLETQRNDGELIWQPYHDSPKIVAESNGDFEDKPEWFESFFYEKEAKRGLEDLEDLACPGEFHFHMENGDAILLLGADQRVSDQSDNSGSSAEAVYEALQDTEHQRRISTPRIERSAQQYIVKRASGKTIICLLYTSPSPRDGLLSRMPSSA